MIDRATVLEALIALVGDVGVWGETSESETAKTLGYLAHPHKEKFWEER